MTEEKKKDDYATRIVGAIFELKLRCIHSDIINPMNEKRSRKEKRNVLEGKERRSRNGKNE